MYHTPCSPKEFSSLLKNVKWQSADYPDWMTLNQAVQHADNAASGFWYDLSHTQYAYNDLTNNMVKINDQFNDKLVKNINTKIRVGQIGSKFVVLIVPGAADSNRHVYIFFPNKDSEINTELKSTFSV
jgi:hypothetical protein